MKHADLVNLEKELSSHDGVEVKRFIRTGEFKGLTNFAYAELSAGQSVEKHAHQSMNEFFFVLSGDGKMHVNGTSIQLIEGKFVAISAHESHSIRAKSPLKLLYFGLEN